MKHKIFIFFTALFLLCNFSLHAQVDTKGTDFWLAFGNNGNDSYNVLKLEPLPTDCPTGTLLFREDFGGNSPNDPIFSTTPLIQCSYTFATDGDPRDASGNGRYALRKVSIFHGNWWYYPMDDHTYPNDLTRGYLMQIDASNEVGQFYETQIDNLCAGSLLNFSVWGMSSVSSSGFANANISLVLEKPDGSEIARKNVELINQRGYWEQFSLLFSLPAGESSIVFRILNNSTASMGNDFMLDDIEIRLCTPPATIAVSDNEVCEGDLVQFVGSFTNDGTFAEPLEYRWLKSATGDLTSQASWTAVGSNSTLNIPNVAFSDNGYYRLAVSGAGNINMENCRAMSEPIYLSVNPLPEFTFGTDLSTACNTPYPFELILPTGGTYTCLDTDHTCGCNGDGHFYPRDAGHGSHDIKYTYEDQYGCVSSIDTTIIVMPIVGNPKIEAIGSTAFCAGDSVLLSAIDASIADAFYFQWLYNGNAIVGATANSYTAKLSGIYTLYIESKDKCASDSVSNEIVVTVYELPTNPIISPSDTINLCDGQSVLLTVTSVGAEYFQWFKNGVAIPLGVSSTYLVYDPGKYTVEVISIEQCAPKENSNVVEIIVIPSPETPVLTAQSATDFCEGESVVLKAEARNAISFEWYKDNVLIAGVTEDTCRVFETGDYYVKAIGGGDCYAQFLSNEVRVIVRKNPLVPTIYPSPAPPYYYGVDYRLNLSPTENGVRYRWYKDSVFIGELGISHFLPMLKDSDSGLYYVEAINEYCTVYSPDFILAPIEIPDLFIPNVFTPNGDGINDNFYILGLAAFPENELTVINKRGKLVYSKKYYDNSWDGEGQPDDIYYYYFKVISPEGEKTVHRGYVYIKREK